MTRETKLQREQRIVIERENMIRLEAESYVTRLLEVLEIATKAGFEITVKSGNFHVADLRDGMLRVLSVTYNESNETTLQILKCEAEYRLDEIEEAESRYNLRINAIAKLSQEEREILGL